jgi:hypothetical protein
MAPALFHPWLRQSLEYLVSSQIDEYARLYGGFPNRIDGHHHMHLCTDVLAGGLLPPGGIVRRSFTFSRGEKSWANRFYRQTVDRILARRHRLTDLFFSITPLEHRRLTHIANLTRQWTVEVETHPANPEEHRFLAGGEFTRLLADIPIAPGFIL